MEMKWIVKLDFMLLRFSSR